MNNDKKRYKLKYYDRVSDYSPVTIKEYNRKFEDMSGYSLEIPPKCDRKDCIIHKPKQLKTRKRRHYMPLFTKDARLTDLTQENNQLREDNAHLARKISTTKSDRKIAEEDIKQLKADLSAAEDRAEKIADTKTKQYEIEIEELNNDLGNLQERYDNLLASLEDQVKTKSIELQIKIDLLNAELEAQDSISKQQHQIEIAELKSRLKIEVEKVTLYKQQYKGTSKFTDQMLTTIQIMGTAKADAANAKSLIELTHRPLAEDE